MTDHPRVIQLTEYQEEFFQKSELTEEFARAIHSKYGPQIDVQVPNFLNDHTWSLKSKGWVGYIPVNDGFHLALIPKVPVANLFRMLEYAYRLRFDVLEGLIDAESIVDMYERLASILAKKVLSRIRMGLYRAYLDEDDDLPFVRGRINVADHLRNPHRMSLPCSYEDHTADLEDNQILLWTLTRILQAGVCSRRTLPYVRQARRGLLSFSSLNSFSPDKCIDRLYNRLNQDYEPLHALCRFFLENTGPTYLAGDRRMLPILVNMAQLFELFVVEWLKKNMPKRYLVRAQENVQFLMGNLITIRIDITIEDIETASTVLILDTKYKDISLPSSGDVEQVVAYAEAKGCNRAALVYPSDIEKQIKGKWGSNIEVRSLSFPIGGDIEQAGRLFLSELLGWVELPNN